ncbi:hypothetical protein CA3LBN_003671 [Candidozyma haemuli]|uniref:Uncharacterized protein n=1 Tax=Candidozyma haemuli TaxID=45357 RepID=A0ABX8IA33_9ASCO|nr:hypothetical protein CA3LBN_003671 [[Candida] haemuloni]
MCSALLGQQSCFYVSRAEYFVSRASAGIALNAPRGHTLWSYVKPRWIHTPAPLTEVAFKFKSPNLVRKLVTNWNLTTARYRLVDYAWLSKTRRKA